MGFKDRIKFIYFDLDNTVWDFKRNTIIALQKVYNKKLHENTKHVDFDCFSDVYIRNNERAWRAFERGEVTADELEVERFDKTIEKLEINGLVKAEELNRLYIENLVQLKNLMPNTKKILNYLTANYALGILSNGFENIQHEKLESSGIIKYFKTIITSDAAGVSKPHPKIFDYAIEKSGFRADQIAYVGDDYKVDALGANRMGITGILLDPENNIIDEDIIKITNLIELKNYF